MPIVRAGRLPHTASVVDAVFNALEQEAPTSGKDRWGLVSTIRRARNRFLPMAPPKWVGFRGIEDYQEVEHEGLGVYAQSEEARYNVGMYVAINLLSEMARKMLCSGKYVGGERKALNDLIKQLQQHEHKYVKRMKPGDLDYDSASRYIESQVEVPRRDWNTRKKIDDAVHYMVASDPSKYDD